MKRFILRRASLRRALCALSLALATSTAVADEAADAVRHFREDKPYAYDEVVALGDATVEGVAAILRDRKLESKFRFMAANALGDIGSKKGMTPLLEALKDVRVANKQR
jgi:HEAT repeat protein